MIVGEAAYRRRGTAALTIAVALVVVVDYRNRHRGANATPAAGRASRITGRVIVAVAAVLPVAAVAAGLAGAAAAGWAYAAFLIAFTGVVAQTTWEPDPRARRTAAGAGLLFAILETMAAAERIASGTVVPDAAAGGEVTMSMALTALTLFGVLAALAVAAFLMTFDLRALRRR